MTDTSGGYEPVRNPQTDAERDEQYGVVGGHNTRCASLLGQGCDCRSPWDDAGCGYSVLNFWHRWGCVNGGRRPR